MWEAGDRLPCSRKEAALVSLSSCAGYVDRECTV